MGAFTGFQNGLPGQAFVQVEEFAERFPLIVRLRAGYTATEPGDPVAARRVFINDATNGTPEEAGRTLDFGLDGLYPLRTGVLVYGGVRHTRFRANFNFIGGNGDFDVTSSHWGLAAGVEAFFPMGSRASLLVSGGAEYMFPARLSGHDTSYSPDGDHVPVTAPAGRDHPSPAGDDFQPVVTTIRRWRLSNGYVASPFNRRAFHEHRPSHRRDPPRPDPAGPGVGTGQRR